MEPRNTLPKGAEKWGCNKGKIVQFVLWKKQVRKISRKPGSLVYGIHHHPHEEGNLTSY